MSAQTNGVSDRLTYLEERMAYLEAQLDEALHTVSDLEKICAKLQDQIKILAVRQGEISAVRDLKDEVPPPHY